MKLLIFWMLCITSLLSSDFHLTSMEKAWIQRHKNIIFTGDPNWLPFEAIDEKGNYQGIVAEYLKWVEKLTGLHFRLHPTKSWTESLAVATNAQVHLISGDVADAILNQNYKPITPYLIQPIVIIMTKDAHYVEDLNHLRGKKVAIIKGYGYTADLFKHYPRMQFVEVENIQEGLKGISLNHYDALLSTQSLAHYSIRQMGLENLKVVGKSSVIMELTLFVNKKEPILHKIINKAIAAMPLEKSQTIIKKWTNKESEIQSESTFFRAILLVLALILIFYIIMYRRLKKSSDFYQNALKGSNLAVWHWDISKDVIHLSPRLLEILGYSENDQGNRMSDWTRHVHPEDRIMVEELLKHNKEGLTDNFTIEYRIAHHDGSWKWIRVRAKTIFNRRHKAIRMDGICTDISLEKEKQLRDFQKTRGLEVAQEIGHMGSWEWNIATGALTWSDEVYRIFGEEPQSFPPTYEDFLSYIPKEYREGLNNAINQSMRTKAPYEYDHEIVRKDGVVRLVREAGYVLFDADGKPKAMLGTLLDIDSVVEVKTTRRENRELNDLLKKFDENVIASNTDLNGIITYASKAFSEISGYSIEELVGKSHNIIRHKDTPKEVFKDIWETITAGKVWRGEIKNRRKDGTAYWVDNTISPVYDINGVKSGYSAIRHDRTHVKEVEVLHTELQKKSEELMTLNKELEQRIETAVKESKSKDHLMAQQSKLASMGEMIGNIAHQWRQPLNALGLLLQKQQIFFDKGAMTSDKMKENIDRGTALIQKMSTTIDDFRDFFKPNKEKLDFDLKEAIEDTIALVDAALYSHNIEFTMDIQSGLIVHGYKNEFSQVILNLVNNAKDALVDSGKKDGMIQIRSHVNANKITIEVSDNAGGIEAEVIESIFEPYFTTKDEGKGTGIGLYMSKMIIEENMDGLIKVENCDGGAKFTIELTIEE